MAKYVDVEKAEYPYMSMSMWGVNSKDCKAYNEGVKATEDMIMALPTADVVELKHGEWLHKKIDEINNHVYGQCSNCLERKRIDNYCPNCGAKMNGKDNNVPTK